MNSAEQWNAADYASNSSGQSALAQELIGKLSLKPNHNVLDIGCGDGKITRELAFLVPQGQVLGIDSSEAMIRHAQAHHSLSNLSFLQMDAQAIHLPRTFDCVFSNAALHWARDQQAVVHGIRRVLSPGGNILLQLGGVGNARELINAIQAVQQSSQWRDYFKDFEFPYRFPAVNEYRAWLAQAGFSIDRVELLDRGMDYKTVEGFMGWLRTAWFPMAGNVPRPLTSQFWQAVCDYLLGKGYRGEISIGMKRLEVQAHGKVPV